MHIAYAQGSSEQMGVEQPAPQQVVTVAQARVNTYSFTFHRIEARDVIGIIADIAPVKIVVADNVRRDNKPVNLKNVTWEQALDAVAKIYNLSVQRQGNVVTVTQK